jgi:hypothetical protein
MGKRGTGHNAGEKVRYAIVVEGELPLAWKDWFGVDRVRKDGACSVLEVLVSDQAQLHGILRRVHDLHIKLCSVRLADDPCGPRDAGAESQ